MIFLKRKVFLVLMIALCLISFQLHAQQSERLINGWEYVQGDIGSHWEAFNTSKKIVLPTWKSVALPHSFNSFDAVDPDVNYYQGPGWYRTMLSVENPYKKGRTLLHFEGSGQKTEVYVFDAQVGSHVGGYDEFSIDITEAVENYRSKYPDAVKIPLAIRCDNTRDTEMIPSDLSDFNIYGGLYRYVNLVYQPELALERIAVDYVLDKKLIGADVTITGILTQHLKKNTDAQVDVELRDAEGKLVFSKNTHAKTWEKEQEILNFKVDNPKLWSPKSPYLYQLKVSVENNGEKHNVIQNVGFRQFEFVEKGPFKINNERLLLRGTHRHEDHAGMASAMTENLMRQEMIMMKEMGLNFIRLGHYQQSPIILNLCDSLGILVWEEIPWCRGGLGGEVYKTQARRMLTNMIQQHYNHPSIIIWGLGNENDWPGDFEEFDTTKIQNFMSELNDLSHSLDPVRKTAIRRCNFCKHIIDVYSPSIWAGWYRGKYTAYQEVSYKEAMDVNHFLHVEWGASNHAGRHSESPDQGLANISSNDADERSGDFLMSGGDPRVSKDGDWSETYACNLIDWHLKEQENMPWLTGTAYWPFKDFSTPLRPENPVPYVNQKGVVQRDFRPKEAYYVFQSYWITEPMVHIYGHTWPTRWGKEGEGKLVKVYSNCEKAELFLNGESLGVRKRDSQNFPAAGLRWATPFLEGENHLKVIATHKKIQVEDEIKFTYQIQNWGEPEELTLQVLSQNNDTALIEARILDANGLFCPDAKNLVVFGVTGNAELIDNLGTSDGSRNIQLYNGRAMIKLKLHGTKAVASVISEGIKPGFVEIKN